MTDDLVKRLRFGVALDEQGNVSWCNQEVMFKAADRIEKLETALREIDRTSDNFTSMSYAMFTQTIRNIARKALEEKDV